MNHALIASCSCLLLLEDDAKLKVEVSSHDGGNGVKRRTCPSSMTPSE